MFGISAYAQTSFASIPTSGNVTLQKLLSVVSTSSLTLLTSKTINVILTVFSYISFGTLNSFAINNNAINNASTTNGVISTNTIINKINKTFSYVSSVASSLTNSSVFLRLLSVVATSTNTILKGIQTTKTVVTNSTASAFKVRAKIISYISTTTNSLIVSRAYLKLLSVVVASTATIQKARAKILLAISTTSSFVTTVTARFVLLVTTVYTSVVSHFYKVLPNIEDTIFVPTKKVIVQVFAGFKDILVRPRKTNIVVIKQDDVNG